MTVKDIVEYDIVNYKKPSMFIITTSCTFKCEKECGIQCCQNEEIIKQKNIVISDEEIVKRYINNPLSHAIVFGGLEPFDTFDELTKLITLFRFTCEDDIVIYTGYYENEIKDKLDFLKSFPNVIVKFGRFIPNQKGRFDEVLGVKLASENQYAQKIS